MKYASTRQSAPAVLAAAAMRAGLAPDGGLYVPQAIPRLGPGDFEDAQGLAATACVALAPYLEGDRLRPRLTALCSGAFNFPIGMRRLPDAGGAVSLLELFHGPTAAFKDFGARFLAACLEASEPERPVMIVVATSGDTGGAVAAAFHGRPGFEVVILYPRGRVSPIQELQLGCWGGNVRSYAVEGSFDDCQSMARALLADPALGRERELSSANSINIGRLLPQAAYFAWASLRVWRAEGRPAQFIIPSGNLGHGTACLLARHMGLPIGEIVLAQNANRPLVDYLDSGEWQPRPSQVTLAPAMDVGDPGNFERLQHWHPQADTLRAQLRAVSVSDAEIRAAIRKTYAKNGVVVCPHTATALHALEGLPATERREGHWVIAATAHPAKFPDVVNPLVGCELALPASLSGLAARAGAVTPIAADVNALKESLSCH